MHCAASSVAALLPVLPASLVTPTTHLREARLVEHPLSRNPTPPTPPPPSIL
jgi:hypothetical protein